MYLYLHIPFCRSHCIYCDFYVVLEKYGGQKAYVEAVLREIRLRFTRKEGTLSPLQTLYIGGGTPSLLQAEAYHRIFQALQDFIPWGESPEITLEVNPCGIVDSPKAYGEIGINRLSVGIQSFNDVELKRLSRIHTGDEAMACIHDLQAAGFQNISLDLMYGIPDQTEDSWQTTLEKAMSLNIPHISMYGLSVHQETPLHRLVEIGAYGIPDDEVTVDLYLQAVSLLEGHSLHRYEFSNFAKPNHESRHNLNYWDCGDFYALGVSAHGLVKGVQYETVRNLETYLQNPLATDQVIHYTPQQQLENAIIFGLRKTEGIEIPRIEARYQVNFQKKYDSLLNKYEALGYLEWSGDLLKLTPQAIPLSNSILADFLD